MSISMCLQIFITTFHSVQEIGPFSLFQNLELGKASTDEKCHFAISWARSCQYQCLRKSLSKYSTQFKIGLFSLFQNMALGKASTNDKCNFGISWTRCRQYHCVCKILSKYSERFKSYRHFSRTGRGQNLHKPPGDKIKCLIIGHTMKVNLQFQLPFLGSCN